MIERAIGRDRTLRWFSTALLTRLKVIGPIRLRSQHAWVNHALAAFPGNLIARRVITPGGVALNVISLHMPSWRVPYDEFTDGGAFEVKIPGYAPVHMGSTSVPSRRAPPGSKCLGWPKKHHNTRCLQAIHQIGAS